CSTTKASPLTTSVIRETEGSSVSPTDKLSILYPRAENSPATRDSTPNLFSTITAIVCFSEPPVSVTARILSRCAQRNLTHSLQVDPRRGHGPVTGRVRARASPAPPKGRAWEGAVE